MTKTSPPPPRIEWEPQVEGIVLGLRNPHATQTVHFRMPMQSVHELRDDMTEAAMLARGLTKVEDFAQAILIHDRIILMGDTYEVENVLEQAVAGNRDGEEYEVVIQFKLNTYSPVQAELIFPPDQMVTAWRPVE